MLLRNGFVGWLLMGIPSWIAAQELPRPLPIETILELPAIDNITVQGKAIEVACSQLLAAKNTQPRQRVVSALRHRGLCFLRTAQLDSAERDFREACQIQPDDAECLSSHAAALIALNRPEEAAEKLRRAIKVSPTNPGAHVLLGVVFWSRADSKKALDEFDLALASSPSHSKAYYVRATCLLRTDPARSLQDIDRFLELCPYYAENPASPYLVRGRCLLFLNRSEQALSTFLMASKLDPTSPHSMEGLSATYGSLRKYRLASHYADRLITVLPNAPSGYALAAEYRARIGKRKGAEEAIDKLLSFSHDDPVILYSAGTASLELQRYDAALGFFDLGLQLRADDFRCLIGKAHLLATCPDARHRDGDKSLRTAMKAHNDRTVPRWEKWRSAMAMAEAHAELGNFAQAIQFTDEAIQIAGPSFGGRQDLLRKRDLFREKKPYRHEIQRE